MNAEKVTRGKKKKKIIAHYVFPMPPTPSLPPLLLTENDIDDEGNATGKEGALRDRHTGVLQITRDVGPSCSDVCVHVYGKSGAKMLSQRNSALRLTDP